jgi:hypothetical protein
LNTFQVTVALLAKVAEFGTRPGAGTAAKCTTAPNGPACSST